jgi:hypothetical protein
MDQFVRTLAVATGRGAAKILHSLVDVNSLLLAEEYPIAAWRNDNSVDLDVIRLFRSLVTRAPTLGEEVVGGLVEYRFNGQEAPALGFAYLEEDLSVSLASNASWDTPILDIEEHVLGEDGELETNQVQVLHASSDEHIDVHEALLTPPGPGDGKAIWENRDELYPGLTFLDRVEKDLSALGADRIIARLHRRLSEMSAFAIGWDSGPLDVGALPMRISPDSEATLNQFSEERTFVLPDGTTEVFSWHVKLGIRIRVHVHFRGPGDCYVGYVGPHLRTARFPN